eukprot:4206160-Pleurochrysis_carterae.AAC.3
MLHQVGEHKRGLEVGPDTEANQHEVGRAVGLAHTPRDALGREQGTSGPAGVLAAVLKQWLLSGRERPVPSSCSWQVERRKRCCKVYFRAPKTTAVTDPRSAMFFGQLKAL